MKNLILANFFLILFSGCTNNKSIEPIATEKQEDPPILEISSEGYGWWVTNPKRNGLARVHFEVTNLSNYLIRIDRASSNRDAMISNLSNSDYVRPKSKAIYQLTIEAAKLQGIAYPDSLYVKKKAQYRGAPIYVTFSGHIIKPKDDYEYFTNYVALGYEFSTANYIGAKYSNPGFCGNVQLPNNDTLYSIVWDSLIPTDY